MRSTGTLTMALLVLGLTASCGGDTTTTPQDMAGGGGGTTLTNLPTGCAPGVTADKLFTDTYMGNCAFGGCHGDGATTFVAKTAADLKGLVGKAATQTAKMPLVTAGDPQKSYLMYKLLGQQTKAGGSGLLMPQGAGTPQPANDLCKYLIWIQEGAK